MRHVLVLALLAGVSTQSGCAAPKSDQGQGQGGSVGTTPTLTVTVNIGTGSAPVTITPTPTAAPAATSSASATQPSTVDVKPAVGDEAIKNLAGAVVPKVPVPAPDAPK